MKQYCLTLDLINDTESIAAYEAYHQAVWPEVLAGIKAAGIEEMEIYRTANRLCMILKAKDDFSFEMKSAMDAGNKKIQEWEALMWNYQQALPGSRPGEKWILMNKIFSL